MWVLGVVVRWECGCGGGPARVGSVGCLGETLSTKLFGVLVPGEGRGRGAMFSEKSDMIPCHRSHIWSCMYYVGRMAFQCSVCICFGLGGGILGWVWIGGGMVWYGMDTGIGRDGTTAEGSSAV